MRTLALGDIHGWLNILDTLLEEVAPGAQDRLITLGDYVDRGPAARGVLDRLLHLHRTGTVVSLRGNHDLMLLEARSRPDMMWLTVGGQDTLRSYGIPEPQIQKWLRAKREPFDLCEQVRKHVPEEHWHFLTETCVDYFETSTHLFVHANAYPELELREQPDSMLFWEKLIEPCVHCSGKILVCGHTRQKNGLPLNWGTTICIDTGVYEKDGWLTCLDVQTGQYWQVNQSGQVRTDWLEEVFDPL